MSLFLETIKIEGGELQYLDLHLRRIQNTCVEYYGEQKNLHDMLAEIPKLLNAEIPKTKLSIRYDLKNHFFSRSPYVIKKVENVFLVVDNELDYHLKYADRKVLDHYAKRAGANNEIIIIQNQILTDCTYANLAFWNGNEWHTPLHPLLKGTKRGYLIQTGQICEKDIFITDLKKYEKVSLINAMLELGDLEVDIERIVLY